MKKIFVLILVMVAFTSATFAVNPSDYDVFYKLNDNSTFKSLVHYLKVDNNRAERLKNVCLTTATELKSAQKSEDNVAAANAIDSNFANAKKVLTSKQYKMYSTIVNLTISNRNYEVLLAEK